jgi:ATP synthase protein I
MDRDERLTEAVRKQADRRKKAEKDLPTLLSQTVFLGTLGLVFVLPVIGGAYLGVWLDRMIEGYSVRWTASLILVGVFVGAINVYMLIKD